MGSSFQSFFFNLTVQKLTCNKKIPDKRPQHDKPKRQVLRQLFIPPSGLQIFAATE
jgi:hypothetical protein